MKAAGEDAPTPATRTKEIQVCCNVSTDLDDDAHVRVAAKTFAKLTSDLEIHHPRNVVKVSSTLIEKLMDYVEDLETKLSLVGVISSKFEHFLDSKKVIYLIGGYNGITWLSILHSFSPSMDMIKPLKSMNCSRSYALTATLNGNIYVFVSGDGSSWFDSVECYNPSKDEWAWCPNLICPKGSLAGATLCSNIFATGGGDGNECFSDVKMLDTALGKWINVQPMLQKAFLERVTPWEMGIITTASIMVPSWQLMAWLWQLQQLQQLQTTVILTCPSLTS